MLSIALCSERTFYIEVGQEMQLLLLRVCSRDVHHDYVGGRRAEKNVTCDAFLQFQSRSIQLPSVTFIPPKVHVHPPCRTQKTSILLLEAVALSVVTLSSNSSTGATPCLCLISSNATTTFLSSRAISQTRTRSLLLSEKFVTTSVTVSVRYSYLSPERSHLHNTYRFTSRWLKKFGPVLQG